MMPEGRSIESDLFDQRRRKVSSGGGKVPVEHGYEGRSIGQQSG
jgi:hypothetical protein